MNNIILTCPKCNRMFKIIESKVVDKKLVFITDFGDKFVQHNNETTCVCCNNNFSIRNNYITTDDWIANMIFTVKGS